MPYLRVASIVTLIVVTVLALAACASEPTTMPSPTSMPPKAPAAAATATTQPVSTAVPTKAPAPTAVPQTTATAPTASDISASTLATKAKAVTEYSFDFTVNAAGQALIGKSYVKGMKMRQELSVAGQNTVMLLDLSNKVAYTLLPGQKTAMKLDFSQVAAQAEKPTDRVGALPANARQTGTETVDGKSAAVFEVPDSSGVSKLWIWTEQGLPLKMEITTPGGKTVMEFSNYRLGAQPDSLFELPAGTEVMEIPAGMPALPVNPSAPGR